MRKGRLKGSKQVLNSLIKLMKCVSPWTGRKGASWEAKSNMTCESGEQEVWSRLRGCGRGEVGWWGQQLREPE